MIADRVFLDTNVLISAVLKESPRYFHARGVLRRLLDCDCEVWVSRQVLRELLAGLSRPQVFAQPLRAADTIAIAQEYEQQFVVAEDHALVTQQLYLLLDKVPCGGKQVHDANIVATMLAFDVPQLITYNVADFQRFAGFIAVTSEI
ncbi:MAG: PIN domain-containing protein [Polyangia bacterium]